MAYAVEFTQEAEQQIAALPAKIGRQVLQKAERLATNPRPPRHKRLATAEHLYRVRSGDYRILYQIDDDRVLVLVVKVGNRRDIYRRLPEAQ